MIFLLILLIFKYFSPKKKKLNQSLLMDNNIYLQYLQYFFEALIYKTNGKSSQLLIFLQTTGTMH